MDKLGFLWEIYIKNVEPLVKIFHVPSMQRVIENAISNTGHNSIEIDCLLAAIKLAAVTSLTDEQCLLFLASSRSSLLKIFSLEVQSTLKSSNFMTSHDLITLQAYVIFLVSHSYVRSDA
jgi:hypothetical protein